MKKKHTRIYTDSSKPPRLRPILGNLSSSTNLSKVKYSSLSLLTLTKISSIPSLNSTQHFLSYQAIVGSKQTKRFVVCLHTN